MPDFDLPVVCLEVYLRAQDPIRLPPFAGSKLHGVFGEALYDLACTRTDLASCQPCPLRQICPYAALYQPALPEHLKVDSLGLPPSPIIFRTELNHNEQRILLHSSFGFGMVVVGSAIQHLPYIVAALERMGSNGIGITKGRFELMGVVSHQPYTQQTRVLKKQNDPLLRLEPMVLNQTDLPALPKNRMVLQLETFLHLREQNRVVGRLEFPILVKSLQRRISNVEQIYGAGKSLGANYSELPRLAQEVRMLEQDTGFASQKRSGHGQRPVVMNGLTGSVVYEGDLEPFGELLRLGELVGVGKWSHFGAGRYTILKEEK